MNDLLQEFFDSRGVTLRLDRAAGVVRGIKVLGLHSRNGREYLPEALTRAVGLYEGAKVNVNHPKGHPLAPRDYEDRIGVIRNVQHRAGEGLFADFHFNPKHDLAEQLAWDAEHAPENVGFSHNVQARTSRRGETLLVDEILQVHSVDLVADPATTRGLFESAPASSSPSPSTGPLGLAVAREGRGEGVAALDNVSTIAAPTIQEQQSESYEKRLREQAEELAALRSEVDRWRVKEATDQRRAKVLALLSEYGLPQPDSTDAVAKAIVSQSFLQALLSASDEPAMRRLVEERARLVGSAQQWRGDAHPRHQRPMSRDQAATDVPGVIDARSFARAITH